MKINCYVIFGWAIAYASNALCVLVEGPFDFIFQLEEYKSQRLSNDLILEPPDKIMYLYKYSNGDNYGIGCSSEYEFMFDENQAFAANEIDYHIMNRNDIRLPLRQRDLLLIMKFTQLEDAQRFYSSSFDYENRKLIGPFELKFSLMGQITTFLNLYELDTETMLCVFEAPNNEISETFVPQLVLPTTSFSHTRIYHLRMMALIENSNIPHILKFKTNIDATAFKTQMTGKSVHVGTISKALQLLIDYFNDSCDFN